MSAPHGYGRYSNGCRCDICKAAKRAYMAVRREPKTDMPAVFVVLDPAVTHGTRFAYEERGCRCRECMIAERTSTRNSYTPVSERP